MRNLKFLTADVGEMVIVQCNEYPVMNGVGETLDDAMEQMALILLVHLRGKRTGRPYIMAKANG